MQHINALPLFALTIFVSTSVVASDSKAFDQKNLHGSWNCKHAMEDANTKMTIDYNIDYLPDGKSNGNGTILLRMQNFPEMEYSLSNSSTWEVSTGSLILSSTKFKLINRSHPELDSILNLESLFTQNIQESSTILELSSSRFVAQSDSYGGVFSCSKIAKKATQLHSGSDVSS